MSMKPQPIPDWLRSQVLPGWLDVDQAGFPVQPCLHHAYHVARVVDAGCLLGKHAARGDQIVQPDRHTHHVPKPSSLSEALLQERARISRWMRMG